MRMAVPGQEQHLTTTILAPQDFGGGPPIGRIDQLRTMQLEAGQLGQTGTAEDGMNSHGYSLRCERSVN